MYIIDDVCYAGEAVSDIKVKEATVLRGSMLLITFSTGEQRLFDATLFCSMKPYFIHCKYTKNNVREQNILSKKNT